MSYTPNVWDVGDVITAAKMNALEQAVGDRYAAYDYVIQDVGGYAALKGTFASIRDAVLAGTPVVGLYFGHYADSSNTWSISCPLTSIRYDDSSACLRIRGVSEYNCNFSTIFLLWNSNGIEYDD